MEHGLLTGWHPHHHLVAGQPDHRGEEPGAVGGLEDPGAASVADRDQRVAGAQVDPDRGIGRRIGEAGWDVPGSVVIPAV